jgi:hypothetical protein
VNRLPAGTKLLKAIQTVSRFQITMGLFFIVIFFIIGGRTAACD